jgi:hypothetical protein
MKKSLLAALIAGILLLSVGAFAGTITVSDIPDIYVADDGNPTGTAGDRDFVFSQPFAFADYVSVSGGSSTNPITVSYVVVDASATIDSALALEIEGVAHPLATSGGETAPVALGTVAGLDSGAEGISAGILFLEYVNTPALYDTALNYDRVVKFIGENGDDDPGTGSANIFLEEDGTDRFSGVPPLFIDTFDSDSEGWIFTSILGSSTEASGAGTLDITYNNTMVFSYWLRPIGTCDALAADTLYRAQMDVSSSVASSSTAGDIPDFRVATSLANGASQLYFVSSFLSDGGSNYISPLSAGRSYEIYFEPTGAAAGQTSDLVLQFEGFNFPFGGRDDLIGETISLTRAEVDPYPAYNVDAAGTVVASIADSAGFATGSGSANGWIYSAATAPGNAEATGSVSSDGEGLDIVANAMGTNTYVYGSWDANPVLASSPITFTGGQLYRATFVITTDTLPSASENSPIPQVRVQTGDSHVAQAGNLYSNFGAATNKQLTSDELTSPDVDLWFYYPISRTDGGANENAIFPAFEMLVIAGFSIPDGAALTLREFELTEQAMP